MKRSALILLTAIYLLSLVGIGVNRFYCCGKLTSVTLTYASANHTDKGNCCKHESKSFKIKDSHVTGNTTVLSPSIAAILPTPAYLNAVNIFIEQATPINYQANAPPGNVDIPIYTLNCAYRI
ncbi:HYC_CC_PP family protein [Mucilaginibacter sp. UYCu711]|uniref:HYC_CC_PP family protein n=1 Tax=Mucilaginibacter sp. UYCu711 TaxID=3156339 RepID=UPI003D1FDF47